MHTLLNNNNNDDILFIQEPWFGQIGTKRSDTDTQGKEVWGRVLNGRCTSPPVLQLYKLEL